MTVPVDRPLEEWAVFPRAFSDQTHSRAMRAKKRLQLLRSHHCKRSLSFSFGWLFQTSETSWL